VNVRTLLAYGADPNLVDCNGDTALTTAASAGHLQIVRDLLQNGASPHLRDRKGRSPRQLAEEHCRALLAVLPSDEDGPSQCAS
jgi:ankyrin repeat protein